MTVKVFYNAKKQIIGTLIDGVFSKKVKRSKHLFNATNSWAIEKSVIDSLPPCKIEITDTENGYVYTTTLEAFKKNAVEDNYGTPQLFLGTKQWTIHADGVRIWSGSPTNFNTRANK